jgi:hypothetical protein
MGQLDEVGAGRMIGTDQVEGDFGVIQDESQFVVIVLAGSHGQAA